MCLQLQCQCLCHRPINNWARKSLHHLWAPHLRLILQDTAPLIQNSLKMLKKMAMPLAPWLIANAAGTSYSLLGENLQRNVRVMFKEERNDSFALPKIFRWWAQPELLPPPRGQYDQLFPPPLLPSPVPGIAPASTVHTHKYMVYRSWRTAIRTLG